MLAIWVTSRLLDICSLKRECKNLKGVPCCLVSLQRYQTPSVSFLFGDRDWQQISISIEPSCCTDVNIKMGEKQISTDSLQLLVVRWQAWSLCERFLGRKALEWCSTLTRLVNEEKCNLKHWPYFKGYFTKIWNVLWHQVQKRQYVIRLSK